mgnify:CR=1 FL=1
MTSATDTPPTSIPSKVPYEFVPFPSDRARLEMVRGGRDHCAPPAFADATVSVIVLAPEGRAASGHAVRAALAQSHAVHEVIVVGPDWTSAARTTFASASACDARVRLLAVPRPGLAPASPRARRFVRAAQYVRAALPHLTGDWVAILGEDAAPSHTYVAALLQAARPGEHELVWSASNDAQTFEEGSFGGTLWSAALAAIPPHDHAGWDSMPPDRAWWSRWIDAGVRAPAAGSPT